jgi:hypothetical protein
MILHSPNSLSCLTHAVASILAAIGVRAAQCSHHNLPNISDGTNWGLQLVMFVQTIYELRTL